MHQSHEGLDNAQSEHEHDVDMATRRNSLRLLYGLERRAGSRGTLSCRSNLVLTVLESADGRSWTMLKGDAPNPLPWRRGTSVRAGVGLCGLFEAFAHAGTASKLKLLSDLSNDRRTTSAFRAKRWAHSKVDKPTRSGMEQQQQPAHARDANCCCLASPTSDLQDGPPHETAWEVQTRVGCGGSDSCDGGGEDLETLIDQLLDCSHPAYTSPHPLQLT
jgi:hypothetical protein